MRLPDFTVIRASTFYIYRDPNNFHTETGVLNTQTSDCYYFDFFHQDMTGGIEIDGVFHRVCTSCFALTKPNQKRKIHMPVSSHFLKISTDDPELKEALDRLPAFGYHPETDQAIDLCKQIFAISNTSTLDGRLGTWLLAASILRIMLRYHPDIANTVEAIPRRHQDSLAAANQYLKDHLDEEVDLEKLAKESNLYPTYFHKVFKAAYGRTPAQQLMYHRLQKAFVLLQDDSCPIMEVALQCGFSSHSYFCYKFKEMWGATPTQYRHRHRTQRKPK